jgi:hypothetical protein
MLDLKKIISEGGKKNEAENFAYVDRDLFFVISSSHFIKPCKNTRKKFLFKV